MSQATRKSKREALIRRRDYLAERVATYRRGGNPSRDKAELGALNWALQVIDAAWQENVLYELEQTAVSDRRPTGRERNRATDLHAES